MQPIGPPDAPIVILVDYPSIQDIAAGHPLSDYAGKLFLEILSRKGLLKTSCLIIPLLDKPLPDDDPKAVLSKRKTCPGPGWEPFQGRWIAPNFSHALGVARELIAEARPRLVITVGELALWALTGHSGVSKWRGSRLSLPHAPYQVLPCLSPRALPRDPQQSHLFQIDLARAKAIFDGTQIPREYHFIISPTFDHAIDYLNAAIEEADYRHSQGDMLYVSGDLETRAGFIACLGLALTEESAICIPFLTVNPSKPFYWSEEEEIQLVAKIAQLFMHPAVISIGQNYLYDCQYYWRHWGILPSSVSDTMIGHHAVFSNMRKGLDFLSSMYARDHVYWKDELKEWAPDLGEKQFWNYNCKDACITFEAHFEILKSLEQENARL